MIKTEISGLMFAECQGVGVVGELIHHNVWTLTDTDTLPRGTSRGYSYTPEYAMGRFCYSIVPECRKG